MKSFRIFLNRIELVYSRLSQFHVICSNDLGYFQIRFYSTTFQLFQFIIKMDVTVKVDQFRSVFNSAKDAFPLELNTYSRYSAFGGKKRKNKDEDEVPISKSWSESLRGKFEFGMTINDNLDLNLAIENFVDKKENVSEES